MESLVAAAISLDVRVNTSIADPQRKSLSSLLQIDPPPPEAVILTCLEVLEAVEAAHSKARSLDLSPQAIEFNRDGKFVVRSMPEPEWNRTLLITSPKYISPETFLEKTEEADQERQASEIYVLGLIFYELLCGRRVFDLEFSEFQGQEQQYLWLSWHGDLNRKAKPLSEVLPGFPESFSGVVAKMMEKRAEHRLKSLQEVRSALSLVKQRLESEEERKSGSTVMMSRDGTKHAKQLARKKGAIGLLVGFAVISALFFLEERHFSEAV